MRIGVLLFLLWSSILVYAVSKVEVDARIRYVNAEQIYARIVAANDISDAPALSQYEVNMVNAMTWEAGEGAIYITDGMLKYASNEDEVALILAHELGHWVHRGREVEYQAEYWADAFGAQAMEIAGYDRCRGALVMWKFEAPDSPSHPPSDARWLAITQGCYGPANNDYGRY
jgi:predicted Zn-dependent protease